MMYSKSPLQYFEMVEKIANYPLRVMYHGKEVQDVVISYKNAKFGARAFMENNCMCRYVIVDSDEDFISVYFYRLLTIDEQRASMLYRNIAPIIAFEQASAPLMIPWTAINEIKYS